jgi:2,4-diaminopentanoate dehydrogenase
MKKYRVIIWGLGSVGRYAVKMIQQKKSLELVGAIDVDPAKVGKDAGEVFGFPKTGVTISDNTDAILNMDADVVLFYLPDMRDKGDNRPTGFTRGAENICRALRARKNVLTTLAIYHVHKTAPKLYNMINTCALENGVTYVQQGIFPGLYNPYLPVVLSSMAGRVDSVIVTGGEDDSYNFSPWVQMFGYGKDLAAFDSGALKDMITSYYGPTTMEIADRVGLEYDEYVEDHEIFSAEVELNPRSIGKVMPGTISAHAFTMRCMKDGKEVTGFHFTHKVCHKIQPHPPIEDKIIIEGEPNMSISIKGMLSPVEPFATSAAPSVNLIPQCVEARPGFVDALDLPASKPVF